MLFGERTGDLTHHLPRRVVACGQIIISISGSLQLLSKIAFSGPYTRNQGNHF